MSLIPCPAHDEFLTPAAARLLALDLFALADAAEGCTGSGTLVTRWEVLAELRSLRERVAQVESLN